MNTSETYLFDGLVIDEMDNAMLHLNKIFGHHFEIPTPQRTVDGYFKKLVRLPIQRSKLNEELLKAVGDYGCGNAPVYGEGSKENVMVNAHHYVRLLSYVVGNPLATVFLTNELLFECGKLAAKVSLAFEGLTCLSLHKKRSLIDMKYFLELHNEVFLNNVADLEFRYSLDDFFKEFTLKVIPNIETLPQQVIHSDINERNVIVVKRDGKETISGLIDFGDVIHSYRVSEIANCMAHVGTMKNNPLHDCGIILAGFLSESELTADEFAALYYFITGRLTQCVLIGLLSVEGHSQDGNDYLTGITEGAAKALKIFLQNLPQEKLIIENWRQVKRDSDGFFAF